MYILMENKIINSDHVAVFAICGDTTKYEPTINKIVPDHIELRAYCSGYADVDGNADYFLIGRYSTKEEAHKVLNSIMTALRNGTAVLDLR